MNTMNNDCRCGEFSFRDWIVDHHQWAGKTFGPGLRTAGITKHIQKELKEIESDPRDYLEWLDVMILALNGAMRITENPDLVIEGLVKKLAINKNRIWPDWQTLTDGDPIEHVRTTEESIAKANEIR